MEIKGTIIEVFDQQDITDKFSKREIVIETGDKHTNPLPVEFVNDRMALVSGARVGDRVAVSAHINGRKWNGPNGDRYFVSLKGFQIDNPDERERFEAPAFEPEATDDVPF